MKLLRVLLLPLLLSGVSVPLTWANSSVNVPLDSWVYHALERLEGYGLIDSALAGTKPYTRLEVARLAAEAKDKWERVHSEGRLSSFARNQLIPFLLERFQKEFRGELVERGDLKGIASPTYWKPVEAMTLRYQYQEDQPVKRPQEATPSTHTIYPIYNNDGIVYRKYHNGTAEFQGELRLWNHLSLYYRPIVKAFEDEDVKVDLRQGYAKAEALNLELEVGRDSLWWGPGNHGALIMTNNAQAFDLIKLSNSYPYNLPLLGPFKFNIFHSRLDNEPPSIKDAWLSGLRLNLKPHPIVELGVSYIVAWGGEGRKALEFGDYTTILFGASNKIGTKLESNKQVSLDLSLRWPNMDRILPVAKSLKIYGEVGAEDHGFLPDRRAYVVGLTLTDLFLFGRMNLRVEYANTAPNSNPVSWYTHGDYPPLFHDRIFGHHMGTNAEDIFGRLTFDLAKNVTLGLDFNLETQGKKDAVTTQSYQTGIDLDFYINQWISILGRYIFERFKDRDGIAGGTRENHLGGVEMRLRF